MLIKSIVYEDFVNYKLPSMFIGTAYCSGKCCIEAGLPLSVCQNDEWRRTEAVLIDDYELCKRYLHNSVTKAIVVGGLEPFEQFSEMCNFIAVLRNEFGCNDDVVIYTGYNRDEIEGELEFLKYYGNIVVKFGRYIPNNAPRFDEVLGVRLASENQYAERIC